MTLSVIADVHLANHARYGGKVEKGVNERARLILATLEAAIEAAPAGELYVLGDLFDVARPEPALIAAAQNVFSLRDDLAVHLLVGNHDQTSEAPGNHAMAPLWPVAKVHDTPSYLWAGGDAPGVLVVPFAAPVTAALDAAVTNHYEVLHRRDWVLLGHWGTADADAPAYLREGKDVVPLARLQELATDFPTLAGVAAGNWHYRKTYSLRGKDAKILQVGALAPTGWDNPGATGYGTLATWTGKGWSCRELPGPRWLTRAADVAPCRSERCTPYLRVDGSAEEIPAEVRAQVAGLSIAAGDDTDNRVAAREAAGAARSAETLAEALAAFVGAMPLSANIDRAEVLAQAKTYLSRSP